MLFVILQNVQTHRFTLAMLSTWRQNQLLWHFISLFAVAIETGFAEEDCVCVRVCVCLLLVVVPPQSLSFSTSYNPQITLLVPLYYR